MRSFLENVRARPLEFAIATIVFLSVTLGFFLIVVENFRPEKTLALAPSATPPESENLVTGQFDPARTIHDSAPPFDFARASAAAKTPEPISFETTQFRPSNLEKALVDLPIQSNETNAPENQDSDPDFAKAETPAQIAAKNPESADGEIDDLPMIKGSPDSNTQLIKNQQESFSTHQLDDALVDVPVIHIGKPRSDQPSKPNQPTQPAPRESTPSGFPESPQLAKQFQVESASKQLESTTGSVSNQFQPDSINAILTESNRSSIAPSRRGNKPAHPRIADSSSSQGFQPSKTKERKANSSTSSVLNPGQKTAKAEPKDPLPTLTPAESRLRHSTLFGPRKKRSRFGFGF